MKTMCRPSQGRNRREPGFISPTMLNLELPFLTFCQRFTFFSPGCGCVGIWTCLRQLPFRG